MLDFAARNANPYVWHRLLSRRRLEVQQLQLDLNIQAKSEMHLQRSSRENTTFMLKNGAPSGFWSELLAEQWRQPPFSRSSIPTQR